MVGILDKYIISKYLKTFFFVILVFSLIAGVIDTSEKIDDYFENNLSLWTVLGDYFFFFLFWINGILFPLYALISVIFFTSRMAYDSEVISILNAGVSFKRLMLPYLIGGGIIALLHLSLNHFLIPIGNKSKTTFENTYVWKNNDKGKTQRVHLFLNPTSKIYLKEYRKRDSTGVNFSLEEFENGQIKSILTAKKVKLIEAPFRWQIKDYYIRSFDGIQEELSRGTEKDTTLNFTHDDFVNYQNSQEAMTSVELMTYINRQKSRGAGGYERFQIEFHRRFADPFTILVLTILGMSIAARKVRGGMGLHLAMGAGLGSVFIMLSQFSATFVTNAGLSPMVGVWIPNLIFLCVTFYFVRTAQK